MDCSSHAKLSCLNISNGSGVLPFSRSGREISSSDHLFIFIHCKEILEKGPDKRVMAAYGCGSESDAMLEVQSLRTSNRYLETKQF